MISQVLPPLDTLLRSLALCSRGPWIFVLTVWFAGSCPQSAKARRDFLLSVFRKKAYFLQRGGWRYCTWSSSYRESTSYREGQKAGQKLLATKNDVAEEDHNELGEEARGTNDVVQKPLKEEGTESEGSEPPLNEEDDDEDDMNDIGQGDDELKTNHLVLAQFEKVTRTKNKWKCILKDGIMHLNNRDILFVKANGEFEF